MLSSSQNIKTFLNLLIQSFMPTANIMRFLETGIALTRLVLLKDLTKASLPRIRKNRAGF